MGLRWRVVSFFWKQNATWQFDRVSVVSHAFRVSCAQVFMHVFATQFLYSTVAVAESGSKRWKLVSV